MHNKKSYHVLTEKNCFYWPETRECLQFFTVVKPTIQKIKILIMKNLKAINYNYEKFNSSHKFIKIGCKKNQKQIGRHIKKSKAFFSDIIIRSLFPSNTYVSSVSNNWSCFPSHCVIPNSRPTVAEIKLASHIKCIPNSLLTIPPICTGREAVKYLLSDS